MYVILCIQQISCMCVVSEAAIWKMEVLVWSEVSSPTYHQQLTYVCHVLSIERQKLESTTECSHF